jgi:hypothetical protein
MLRLLSALLLVFGINGQLQAAIEPVYEGSNGIRNQVLTVCLRCHSASVTGAGRNGATNGVNFDTYAAAAMWTDLLMTKAVIERSMPPPGNTPLNSEQRAALLAWQAAGFPEKAASTQDTQAPTTPTKPIATVISTTEINLAWTAATDNVAVTAYKIYRGGNPIATLGNVPIYVDKTLSAATTYSFSVAACDAAGNCSAQSAAVTATTPQQSDCLFNWAETSFPEYFAPRTQSQSAPPYYYRFYPPGTYLAIASNRLLYFGPLSPTTVLDLGDVTTFYPTARCN